MALGGCPNKESFSILCHAIFAAKNALPEETEMTVIYACVNDRLARRKKLSAISGAIERGVHDVLTYADRDLLAKYSQSWLYELPKPKEFIFQIAASLLTEETSK